MSNNWITVIPEDPRFVPDASRQVKGVEWFKRVAPKAREIDVEVRDDIVFFDCGGNFERVICPSCGVELPIKWWQERMDDDYGSGPGFKLGKYPTPCCGATHTMHELTYDRPQGLGRFALSAMDPKIGLLNEAQRRELEQILGTRLRIIYQHI